MRRNDTGPAGRLTALLALAMLAQAALGRVFPETYRDVEWIRLTWLGNDWVTLLLGLPVLIAGLVLARRGSALGTLLWLGGLGYAFYNGMFYLVGAALNAFLPLYCLVVVLAAAALVLALAGLDVRALAARFAPATPVRAVGSYLVFLGTGLTAVWIVLWAAHVFGGRPAPGGEEPFKIVAALDMTIMVPALVVGGSLLWRRRPWGFAIAAIAAVQGALYLTVLAVNAALFLRAGLADPPGELPMWLTLAILTYGAAGALLAGVARRA